MKSTFAKRLSEIMAIRGKSKAKFQVIQKYPNLQLANMFRASSKLNKTGYMFWQSILMSAKRG